MPDVPGHLIEHSLNVSKPARPIKQKLQRFAHNKKEAIRTEVTWLLVAKFIKEVYHSNWLANPVLVRKKNNEWRMCVDYTDLNKHYPKDPFSLPRIDEVIDSMAGCELLSFLECYSSYHQIALTPTTRSKLLSSLLFGAYCYTTMSFRLKNAGATYQHAIQQCLHDEIRDDLVESYVNDVIIKTRVADSLIDNLDQTFKAFNRYKWKLNPKKCIFGVPFGILLGNIVSRGGIHPNPSKVKAVFDMRPPKM